MDHDPKQQSHDRREQAWLMAWCAVASATDCKKPEVATDWANACLAGFDKQFPSPAPQTKLERSP